MFVNKYLYLVACSWQNIITNILLALLQADAWCLDRQSGVAQNKC
jgi:hypothetical protein